MERRIEAWRMRAASGTLIVTHATSAETARKDAAATLVPIGRGAAASAATVGRLARPSLVDLPRDARRSRRRSVVDGGGGAGPRLIVLVQPALGVPPPRGDPRPHDQEPEDRHHD